MHTFALGTDHAGLEILTSEEALRLLRSQPVGRVALMSGGEPIILPVNHAVVGHAIVFRTGHGTKLETAWHETVVAFEVDNYDAETRAGWSVLVRGRAEQVTDEQEHRRLDALQVDTWVQRSSRWVRIHIGEVSGRRLIPASLSAPHVRGLEGAEVPISSHARPGTPGVTEEILFED